MFRENKVKSRPLLNVIEQFDSEFSKPPCYIEMHPNLQIQTIYYTTKLIGTIGTEAITHFVIGRKPQTARR